jgi:hypothetical protein
LRVVLLAKGLFLNLFTCFSPLFKIEWFGNWDCSKVEPSLRKHSLEL